MKSIIRLVAIVITCASLYAIDQNKLDEFKDKLATALTNKDIKALNLLFYTNGASQFEMDNIIYGYEFNLSHYTFDKIEFQSFDDPKINPASIEFIKGSKMNGHVYLPNLTPVAFCTTTFRGTNALDSVGAASPVGLDPDGSLKFILTKIAN